MTNYADVAYDNAAHKFTVTTTGSIERAAQTHLKISLV